MGKIITVAQQKGGAGKTTITAHLAVALSQRGRRVAVVDIDPQGSLTQWHKMREERFGEGYTGLTFASVSGWRVGSEVARLKKQHDFIFIDSPPHMETEARTAIRNADLLVVPVQPSPTDLWATQATLDHAKNERVPVKIVFNRVPAHSKLAERIAGELDGLSKTTIGNRVIFAASLFEGRTATELEPKSVASQEIKSLAEEVLAMFKEEGDDGEAVTPSKRVTHKEMA